MRHPWSNFYHGIIIIHCLINWCYILFLLSTACENKLCIKMPLRCWMNNSWIRVFPSHLFPSIKLPESNSENISLLCLNSLLYFSTFREKPIMCFTWMFKSRTLKSGWAKLVWENDLGKHTTCNLAKSFIKVTCLCKSLRKVIHQDDMCKNLRKLYEVFFLFLCWHW